MRFAVILFAAMAAAQPASVFRAGISLVHVEAEVVTADGRILTDFSKDDFRVFDQGTPQQLVYFSVEDQPLDLILLFDISGSMRPVVEQVAAAAGQGLHELHPGDRVSVMVFNARSRVVLPFSEDLDSVERSIRQDVLGLRFGGGTLIQQAADDAAKRFLHESRSQRCRAVLIVTDNVGLRTRREQSVVRDFWEADALLSGLIIRGGILQETRPILTVLAPQTLLMQAGMKGIAEQTGGDTINSSNGGPAFQEMMHRIRSRYSLYYAMPPGKPGVTRAIHVELNREAQQRLSRARVRARRGYVVP
jgi:VWFA-related protein